MDVKRRNWARSPLRAVIEDRSIIDTKGLDVRSIEEADSFLMNYGFDQNLSPDRQELAAIREQSIAFLEDILLNEDESIIPVVRNEPDIRQLLIWASEHNGSEQARWSCAVLRVMHCFAHCGTHFTDCYEDQIHNQILGRIEPHIRHENDKVFIGDIEIERFESRPVKSRGSVVLKMLHKAENVSTEIFDWFGIRIVTGDRLDAIRVLEYLIQHNIAMLANIKATKSRNTLLDAAQIKKLSAQKTNLEKLRSEIRTAGYPKTEQHRTPNSFSGSSYHAIQFTCRQRIKIDEENGQRIRFFFPYEVQILDKESYEKTRSGRASHDRYKRRQLEAARRRVLGTKRKTTA